MITKLNKDSSPELWKKYSKLFDEAFNWLNEKDLLSQEEKDEGQFTSLGQYFAHIGDLASSSSSAKYILLPLDETPIEINANTRKIKEPTDFVTIKNDNQCEIITFVIAKYFDFKDLSEAKIQIQWVNANKEEKEEGVYNVPKSLIDFDYSEDILRFGWPVDARVTKFAGKVQFAVRIYQEQVPGSGVYSYLFNTEPQYLLVKDTLNIDIKNVEDPGQGDEFKAFISNSQNPYFAIPAPLTFGAGGGIDLPVMEAIDADNTLTLQAQAVTKDASTIAYQWMYQPEGSDVIYDLNNEDNCELFGIAIDNKAKIEAQNPDLNSMDRYWVKNVDGTYSRFSGNEILEDEVLYEEVTQLVIEDNAAINVVGSYWVNAVNSIGKNTNNPITSSKCTLPGPKEIVCTSELEDHYFIGRNNEKVGLEVVLQEDKGNPDITYSWNMNITGADKEMDTTVSSDAKYYTNTPGWYAVTVNAKLNRKDKVYNSKVCRVTNYPETPVITKCLYEKNGVWQEAGETIDGTWGNILTLKVETNLDEHDALKSDRLYYTWYIQNGNDYTKLTEKHIGVDKTLLTENTVLGTNSITVRCLDSEGPYNYVCVVTNEIAGVLSTSTDIDNEGHFAIV